MHPFVKSCFCASAIAALLLSEVDAAEERREGSAMKEAMASDEDLTAQTVHQFDRFLLVFHYQEQIQFDKLGNLLKKEGFFGNTQIDINPMFVTNQHSETGIRPGKAGLAQLMVLEQPINENSVAAVHFVEANGTGLDIVSVYQIEERPNVFRCFFSRVKNTSDFKTENHTQVVMVNKGLAYPINEEGEHIKKS